MTVLLPQGGDQLAPEQLDAIQEALDGLHRRIRPCKVYRDYYDGNHPTYFDSQEYAAKFAQLLRGYQTNLCPTVVGAVADRLQLIGFTTDTDDLEEEDPQAPGSPDGLPPVATVSQDDPSAPKDPTALDAAVDAALDSEPDPADIAWKEWTRLRMPQKAGRVHLEALRCMDAFVIVWKEEGQDPTITIQRSDQVHVHYGDDDTTREWAAKVWPDTSPDGQPIYRCTLYWPDRVEKFITPQRSEGLPDKADRFIPFMPEEDGVWPLPNRFGEVPVFHFANDAAPGEYGRSELHDVLAPQDALNKIGVDMLTAMEDVALPQRWATGLEIPIDPVTGKPDPQFLPGKAGSVWATPGKDAKFGQFPAADTKGFLDAQREQVVRIAQVSGTPLHFFMLDTGGWPSGEAMKTAEARFVAKVKDRQTTFGDVWADLMSFLLKLLGTPDVQLIAEWEEAEPQSRLETAQYAQILKAIGVPQRQLLLELGYGAEEVEEMLKHKAATAPPMIPTTQPDGSVSMVENPGAKYVPPSTK